LLGSNDNSTWTSLHVVSNATLDLCEEKYYEIGSKKGVYRYVKFIQNETKPGCWSCFSLNNIELHGVVMNARQQIGALKEEIQEVVENTNSTEKSTNFEAESNEEAFDDDGDDDGDDDIAIVGRAPIRQRRRKSNK
jgi:phosphopantothenoylcysteine synthetase/decarboxylase